MKHGTVFHIVSIGGNEGRPFQGIDTIIRYQLYLLYNNSGNEGRPIQGIDTQSAMTLQSYISLVEMKVAPFRALTLPVP